METSLRLGIDSRPAEQGAEATKQAFGKVDGSAKTTTQSIDYLQKALKGFSTTKIGYNVDFMPLAKSSTSAKESLKETEQQVSRTSDSLGMLQNALGGVTAGWAVKKVLEYADSQANLAARISLVTKSQRESLEVQEKLFNIAQRTRSDINATGELYTKLANSVKSLYVPQEELLAITERTNKAFIVSGASTAEASGAIRQLGQALASGYLRGDEFNSVIEQAPILADVIAKSMGVSRGALRELAGEGKITAEVLLKALGKDSVAAVELIEAQFNRMPKTFSGVMTTLGNSFQKFFGDLANDSGLSSGAISAVQFLTNNIDALGKTLIMVAGAGGALMFASSLRMLVGLFLSMANPVTALVALIGVGLAGAFLMASENSRLLKINISSLHSEVEQLSNTYTKLSQAELRFKASELDTNVSKQETNMSTLRAKLETMDKQVGGDASTRKANVDLGNGDKRDMTRSELSSYLAMAEEKLDTAKALKASVDDRLNKLDTTEQSKERITTYLSDKGRKSPSQLLKDELDNEDKEFKNAVKGLEASSADYQNALKAHNTAIDALRKKHRTDSAREVMSAQKELAKSVKDTNAKAYAAEELSSITSIVGQIAGAKELLKAQYDVSSKGKYSNVDSGTKQQYTSAVEREQLAQNRLQNDARNQSMEQSLQLEQKLITMEDEYGGALRYTAEIKAVAAAESLKAGAAYLEEQGFKKAAADLEKQSVIDVSNARRQDALQRQKDVQDFVQDQAKSIAAMQAETDMLGMSSKQRTIIAGQRAIEMQMQTRAIGATMEEKAKIMELSAYLQGEYAAAIEARFRKEQDGYFGMQEAMRKYVEDAQNNAKTMESFYTHTFTSIEDALVSFVKNGKLNFKDLADSIIADLIRIQVRQAMAAAVSSSSGTSGLGGLIGGIMGIFGIGYGGSSAGMGGYDQIGGNGGSYSDTSMIYNANGNVMTQFGPMELKKYAKGGIATFPQLAMYGEGSRPEAIIPLPDGRNVPVVLSGGGGGGAVIVNIIDNAGTEKRVEQRTGKDGSKIVDVFIDQVKSSIAGDISTGSGAVPAAMEQAYQLNRAGGAY